MSRPTEFFDHRVEVFTQQERPKQVTGELQTSEYIEAQGFRGLRLFHEPAYPDAGAGIDFKVYAYTSGDPTDPASYTTELTPVINNAQIPTIGEYKASFAAKPYQPGTLGGGYVQLHHSTVGQVFRVDYWHIGTIMRADYLPKVSGDAQAKAFLFPEEDGTTFNTGILSQKEDDSGIDVAGDMNIAGNIYVGGNVGIYPGPVTYEITSGTHHVPVPLGCNKVDIICVGRGGGGGNGSAYADGGGGGSGGYSTGTDDVSYGQVISVSAVTDAVAGSVTATAGVSGGNGVDFGETGTGGSGGAGGSPGGNAGQAGNSYGESIAGGAGGASPYGGYGAGGRGGDRTDNSGLQNGGSAYVRLYFYREVL